MEIKVFKPNNEYLRESIEYFYILERPFDARVVNYLTFPTANSYVSINEQAKLQVDTDRVVITHCETKRFVSSFTTVLARPLLIRYEGQTTEVNTCFKPLGINAFLNRNLSYYCRGNANPFVPFEDYNTHIEKIIGIKDVNEKIAVLEDYWLTKFKGFDHPFLLNAISDINEEPPNIMTIREIAEKCGVSRPTFNSQFALHLCTTPSQFRRVVRFRRAMKQHAMISDSQRLIDISYLVNYFDQSHMIKDFKALTHKTPKHFFSNLSSLENGEMNWIFT